MENKSGKSAAQKASRGAQVIKGAGKVAGGIASGNFISVAQGAAQMLGLKLVAILVSVLVFIMLLPIIIIL